MNVAAFLCSGFGIVGEPYRDADGNEYLPMLREPGHGLRVDAAGVRRAYERARARGVEELAVFTRELFDTLNDEANRAAVAALVANDEPLCTVRPVHRRRLRLLEEDVIAVDAVGCALMSIACQLLSWRALTLGFLQA